MKICLTAGGTGGHIFPALALASELENRGHEVIYIGHADKMEATLLKQTNYPFFGLNNQGLSGSIFNKIKALFSQFGAIVQAKRILSENKVDKVISFGGYVTFPVCQAAGQLKIPYILHEQNAYAGKANKAVEKKAESVVICYEDARQYFTNPNVYLLGNPRASMIHTQQLNPLILKEYGLSLEKPIIYCVMGSLGSETVSNVIIEMLNTFNYDDIQFIISTGTNNFEVYKSKLKKDIKLFKQVDQISLLPHCTLVISRAGATSIAELMAFGVPSILIPSPYVANNHQLHNAQACVNQHAALMIEEKDLTSNTLHQLIQETVVDKALLNTLSKNAKSMGFVDANENMADLVEKTYE